MNLRRRVVVTRLYPADLLDTLAPHAEVIVPDREDQSLGYEEVCRHAGNLTAIINQGEIPIDARLMAMAPGLKIVANASIGVNNLALDAMRARSIWGINTPDAFVDATADCTLGLLVMLARRLGEGERFVRAGRWRQFAPGTWDGILLRGRTLGLVGYGRIGRAVARRAKPFGLRVIHHTRTRSADPEWRTLDDLLASADFVSLHVPLNDASRGLIDAAKLARMKPGAFLLNLARGAVVDEPALISALRSGQLAGAALDVFLDEPNVPAALCEMENVVLTPHVGGGSREGRRIAQELCVENVRRVLTGESPLSDCVVVAAA
jgi:glyoxylate reductase